VSGVLFVAFILWLVSLAVKSGKKPPMPTSKPYDEQEMLDEQDGRPLPPSQ
jgi:hypothetical protein